MIDIHSHILPRVDDGSIDMDMSIDMAKIYLENNINKVIATPHYIEGSKNTSLENNKAALSELREELYKEGINLEIYLGNEIYVSMDIIKYIKEENVSTLNGTRYILMEFPMFDIPLYVENIIYEILLKGYIPIIAHPERNSKIIEDPNILYKYITMGALAQLNLPSLEGKYGSSIKSTAEILIRHNMIHFVATDAHTNRGRSPKVAKGLEILSTMVSKEDFDRITYLNADLLLENKNISVTDPIKYQEKKGFLKLLKNKIGIF
jgi:protein-tyrosine phosphatase